MINNVAKNICNQPKKHLSPKTHLLVYINVKDMKDWTEKDVENLIKDSNLQNQAHKDCLRRQMFGNVTRLDLDQLDAVAGGKSIDEPEKWIPWAASEEEEK